MHAIVKVYQGKKSMAIDIGENLVELTKNNDNTNIALSGGSTPKAIFELLSLEYKDKINWRKISFFWGDERCVEPIHPESNYGMTLDLLLSKVPVDHKKVFRVAGELDPDKAAAQYAGILREELPLENGMPKFDIVILGLGDDGHTASIFANQIDFWESDNVCEVATHPETGQNRVTITGKIINNADLILFWITGSKKVDIVDTIIHKKRDYLKYPASLADPAKSIWMLDEKAATKIPESRRQ